MRLQGIFHELPSIKAEQLKVGDVLVWNFGYKSKVLRIDETKSGKSLKLNVLSLESNRVLTRTLRKERQVVVA